MTETYGGLDGAVAATNDQNLFVDVVVRLDQTVHHLGKILPFTPSLLCKCGGLVMALSKSDG